MSRAELTAKRAQVKIALAEKYENLANITGAKNRRQTYLNRAERFRRQAREISRT